MPDRAAVLLVDREATDLRSAGRDVYLAPAVYRGNRADPVHRAFRVWTTADATTAGNVDGNDPAQLMALARVAADIGSDRRFAESIFDTAPAWPSLTVRITEQEVLIGPARQADESEALRFPLAPAG